MSYDRNGKDETEMKKEIYYVFCMMTVAVAMLIRKDKKEEYVDWFHKLDNARYWTRYERKMTSNQQR